MPSFTTQVPDLAAVGPVVEILVGPSQALIQALVAKGRAAPPPVRAMAMSDTGASGTVLSPQIVQGLGVQPIGVANISTPSTTHPVPCHQYHVDVVFPSGVAVPGVIAVEAPLAGQPIQCLIGRDILRHGL